MLKWKVGAYLRLSSDDGDKIESNSITNQRSIIELYSKKEKDFKIKDYYIDDGYSGTDFNRPDFQRLMDDIKNGKINTIIVKDLSRFGRNYIEVGNYIEQIFPLYNIRFIAINDNVDNYKDPESINNIIVPFKNLMNDEYARDISNKVRSVLSTKRVNGEFTGISAPYGYLKDPKDKHKFIIDKKSSKVVKKIFKMILDGKSKKEIVDDLNKSGILPPASYKINENIANSKKTETMNIWKTKMLDRILQNQAYTGDLVQGKRKRVSHKVHKLLHTESDNWIIVPNHHEPLISKEEFNQVKNIIFSRDIRVNKRKEYDIFSGHLKCYDCGNSFTIKKGNTCEYYYCSSYLRNKTCSKHTISKNKLIDTILNIINTQIDLLIDIDTKISEITKTDEINYDIEILKNRITEIDEEMNKYKILKLSIRDDFVNKYISKEEYEEYEKEYNFKLKKLTCEKDVNEDKLEKIDFNSEKNKQWIDEFKKNKNLEKLNKKVIDELIEDIFIYENGNVKVIFKYKDEYFEAIDFLKSHNCDIIKNDCVDLNEIA